MCPLASRLIRVDAHDDGVNAWSMARIAAPSALAGRIGSYSDYSERTDGFTARREMPGPGGVLILNLGPPIEIVGGDGVAIRVGPGEGFAGGAHLRHAVSRSSGVQAGVHVFLPMLSLRALLGLPMDVLADRVVPLDALLGATARTLGERLLDAGGRAERVAVLDAAVTELFGRQPPPDARQNRAVRLLAARPDLDIMEVARAIGWSRKHLAARVRDAVGVGPRSYRRLIRFERAVAALGAPPASWAGFAQEAGYCDQSHLIREFREFAGMSPGAFLARSLPGGGGIVEG